MSDNKIQIFKNEEFGQVRAILIDDKPWMVGKDVAVALGYSNTKDALIAHVECEDKQIIQRSQFPTFDIPNRGLTVINESGMYSLILSSKLPSAKRFKRWVTSEVLPSIRKTGMYVVNRKPDSYMIDDPVQRATRWIEEEQERQRLAAKLEEQKPLVDFATAVGNTKDLIDVGQMAKLLHDESISIGRNRLFAWLRENGYLMKDNIPYQKHMEDGIFVVKEILKDTSYGKKAFVKTYVTGKGQIQIVETLRKNLNEKSDGLVEQN